MLLQDSHYANGTSGRTLRKNIALSVHLQKLSFLEGRGFLMLGIFSAQEALNIIIIRNCSIFSINWLNHICFWKSGSNKASVIPMALSSALHVVSMHIPWVFVKNS